MKPYFCFFVLLICLPGLVFSQDVDVESQLNEILNKDVRDGQFVGGVIGLSVRGKTHIAAGGQRDLASAKPFETSTLNRIASIAKPMTAIAALQLYEQGKLDLDEPIATYLPDYPSEHASRITTRHLLLHSSGIGEYKSRREVKNQKVYGSLAEAASVFQDRKLVDEPGRAEHYTTYGYVVLGMVIEAVSGQEYGEYMAEHVWTAAGMQHTGVEHLSGSQENKSSLYYRDKKGKISVSDKNNLSNRVPGGGLQSTADDLLKFGQAVLDHRLIEESTFATMTEEPGLPYDGNPYGMGWFLYGKNPELGLVYGHTGAQTGCSSVLLIMPEMDAVVVVMNNTAGTSNHVFGTAVQLFPLIKQLRD